MGICGNSGEKKSKKKFDSLVRAHVLIKEYKMDIEQIRDALHNDFQLKTNELEKAKNEMRTNEPQTLKLVSECINLTRELAILEYTVDCMNVLDANHHEFYDYLNGIEKLGPNLIESSVLNIIYISKNYKSYQIEEFSKMIIEHVGPKIISDALNSKKIDPTNTENMRLLQENKVHTKEECNQYITKNV